MVRPCRPDTKRDNISAQVCTMYAACTKAVLTANARLKLAGRLGGWRPAGRHVALPAQNSSSWGLQLLVLATMTIRASATMRCSPSEPRNTAGGGARKTVHNHTGPAAQRGPPCKQTVRMCGRIRRPGLRKARMHVGDRQLHTPHTPPTRGGSYLSSGGAAPTKASQCCDARGCTQAARRLPLQPAAM